MIFRYTKEQALEIGNKKPKSYGTTTENEKVHIQLL